LKRKLEIDRVSTDDDKIRTRLAEIMSSAGLGYNQIALEILYLLPKEFIDRYIWLWEKALGPAGGGDVRGQQLARDANLERAQTSSKDKGNLPSMGAVGKRYKKIFVIRDEHAFDLKHKIDKRLRGIAREIRNELEGLTDQRGKHDRAEGRIAQQCKACGKIMHGDYNYCPYDGAKLVFKVEGKG
jgi:hypothetical protein